MQLIEDLGEVKGEIWRSLLEAVESKGHVYRYPVVATISDEVPLQRTVVLRNLFVSSRTLLFHSDSRSRKIRDIRTNPNLCWLFYDSRKRIQIQMHSRAQIHEPGSELHENEWNATGLPERHFYCVAGDPGSPIEDPAGIWPDHIGKPPASPDEVEEGKANFRAISTEVYQMDWLQLHTDQIYRAIFRWENGEWKGSWVRP